MPLTPAEVHNVAFKKPPIGKRGYDEEEVDAFLDIVEVELARLLEENSDLKSKGGVAVASDNGSSAALASAKDENAKLTSRIGELEKALTQGKDQTKEQLVTAQQQLAASEQAHAQTKQQLEAAQRAAQEAQQQAAQAAAQAAAQPREKGAPAAPAAGDTNVQAVQMLALAQQTADQHVAQSKAEAERVINEARSHASAQVADAQAKSDQMNRDSTTKAGQIVQEAEQRASTILGQFEQRKAALERRVEELRTFEREYRTRLKSYLESQLRDLDASGQAEPAGKDGAPAAAAAKS